MALIQMSSDEQLEVRRAQDLLVAQNLSKLEAFLCPPAPPSASSTSSSSATNQQPLQFSALAAEDATAAGVSTPSRGTRDMYILGRVRNHMRLFASIKSGPALVVPGFGAGPSVGLGLRLVGEVFIRIQLKLLHVVS